MTNFQSYIEGRVRGKKIVVHPNKNEKKHGLDGIRTRGLHVANVTIYP